MKEACPLCLNEMMLLCACKFGGVASVPASFIEMGVACVLEN